MNRKYSQDIDKVRNMLGKVSRNQSPDSHGAEVPKEYAGDEAGGKRRSRSNKSKQIITQILSGRELGDYKSKN